ncbi:hypothetical protein [Methylobacterium sp. AMS5]|uniref:hypothetical protein n=1 Tax=Methylobacterium sp. AMS5 TaxID=925818 RepID=UPI000AC5FD16|nr:hypothetical protein [Methylobacterium sp. AMS5]
MSHCMHCLSTHGQVLIYDKITGELRTSPNVDHQHIISVQIANGKANLSFEDEGETWYVMPSNFGSSIYSTPQMVAEKLNVSFVDEEFVYFDINGQQLSAEPDGTVDFKVWREVYEKFWLFSSQSLPILLLNNSWYSISLKRIIEKSQITFKPNFIIKVGEIEFGIKNVNKYGCNIDGKQIYLSYGTYKVEKLLLFKPLMYFSAYGRDQSFFLLKMCIDSIERFGCYDGNYLIITNKSEIFIRSLLDFVPPDRLQLAAIPVVDETDMVCARFKVIDVDSINLYQPIVYSDFDIICNGSIKDMLGDIVGNDPANSSTIFVKSEGPLDHQSYGGVLTLADETATIGRGDRFSIIRSPIGFNSGVIGFRNAEHVRGDFTAVVSCIYFQIENGTDRQSYEVYDQPAANYVYNKIASYDVSLIDKYIHPWPPLENEKIVDKGLIHFCGGVGPMHKVDRIKSYYDYILSESGTKTAMQEIS